jgi:hypothetical protein
MLIPYDVHFNSCTPGDAGAHVEVARPVSKPILTEKCGLDILNGQYFAKLNAL